MKKLHNIYTCQVCGAKSSKWLGRCEDCSTWNSFVVESVDGTHHYGKNITSNNHNILSEIEIYSLCKEEDEQLSVERYDTGLNEFNRVLGGGCVAGSVILLCGEPGIGKSTLVMQLCNNAGKKNISCFYISGEESLMQLKLRAKRLSAFGENIKLITATNVNEIINFLKKLYSDRLNIVIVDSVQTLYSDEISSAPGTVSQVKACTFELIKIAKAKNIVLVIVGHITKDGQIAGPKVLEHMVDTVLYFEGGGVQQHRIVRTIKNRFGSTNEIGVFEMSSSGLNEVLNPSKLFMTEREDDVSGACIFAGLEGTRSLLVEVQALVVHSYIPVPRRAAIGWDSNRLAMIIAILNTRLGLSLGDKEVYLNIAGGLRINEPAADLAVTVALISAARDIKIPRNTVFFGEIGLSGELRKVVQAENRINEAHKLGFENVVVPYDGKHYTSNMTTITQISHITELVKFFSKL